MRSRRRSFVEAPNGVHVRGINVLVFPGLSIMQRQRLSPGVLIVTCPGCGASQFISAASPPTTFVHEDDDCPILRRIDAAVAMLEAAAATERH